MPAPGVAALRGAAGAGGGRRRCGRAGVGGAARATAGAGVLGLGAAVDGGGEPARAGRGGERGVGGMGGVREVLARRRDELRELVDLPVQTNEVGRSSALLFGFLAVAERRALPLRTLE